MIQIPVVGLKSFLDVGKGCTAVLTMSALVSLMEKAACAALEDELDSEPISVGASISVVQMAASTVKALLTATATRGWVNYFGLADMKSVLTQTDEWLRRKIRAIGLKLPPEILKQEKDLAQ